MKRTTLWAVAATVFAGLLLADRALSEDEPAAPKPPSPEQIEKFRALMAPGPEHESLMAMAGEWDVETKVWMEPGQATPMVVKGTATNTAILGGRFLLTRGSSKSQWGTVERMGIMGFDRRHGHYTVSGFDTMGTYAVHAQGKYDESAKAVVMHGTDDDPVLGHTQRYKFVYRVVSKDNYVVEIVFTDKMHTQGKVDEFKAFQVTSTRKQ